MKQYQFYRKVSRGISVCVLLLLISIPVHAKEIQSGLFGLWAYSPWDEGLQLFKDNGFSVVIIDGNRARIDKAYKLGLQCIVDFKFSLATTQDPVKWQKYLADLTSLIKGLKDHPAVIAWYPVDEADGQGIPLDKIKQVRNLIKSVDPKRPIFTVFNAPAKWTSYLPFFDILCVDPYLLKRNPTTGGPDTTRKVQDWLKKIKADMNKLKLHKPIWVTLQGFEAIPTTGVKDWYQKIKPEQFTDMLNISLKENVDGILVYSLATPANSDYQAWVLPKNNPQLWDAVRKIPAKVK